MSEELGSYLPAFFKMKVNVNGAVDLNTMLPKDFSVFFHEYVHFIQDFTTAAGCRRIYVYGEFIRQCVMQVTSGSSSFDVPIQIDELENNVLPNVDLLSKVDGDYDEMSVVKIKSIDTIDDEVTTKDGKVLQFKTLVITTIGEMPISVGTHAITESMAYLLEQLCTSEFVKSPDYPYNIARLIADFVLGENIIDNLVLLSMCDVSLLTSNPGLSFYRMLIAMHNGDLTVKRPEDVYDDFYNRKSFRYDTNQVVPAITDYMQSESLALLTIKSYYNLEHLQDLNEWLDKVFAIGSSFRMNRPYFFLEMARGSKDQSNAMLQFFAKEVGAPLIENNQGQMFKLRLSAGEPPIEYLYVLMQIYRLFKKGDKSCALKQWCEHNPGLPAAQADKRCNSNPWSRCNDTNLCPYAVFWHHRMLSKFSPK